ncbi:P-loop containing nucleoside triphosphate hydrolase protein [Stachybotrys elegans]|uniref:P-loop containing nucleoside triphosphate hydrolase protein n=1 Tax=Stachybotrys elegans TaxID=80388 RepID=A0A8K0WS99_9HYPO|nr:P-loop containing nucleoside triphosphate hydrolase protein [Stachybotrys elegans]
MTDLLQILPSFPTTRFAPLLPSIEQNGLTTTDLLAQHPADIAKQTNLPILDLKRFIAAIHASLSDDIKPLPEPSPSSPSSVAPTTISTLDHDLDVALGGGVPLGCITEFAGESGVGKTQFLLSLCLAVQLPPPRGLGKQALYVSTESGLATRRLAQILAASPALRHIDVADRPSLDNILSTVTPDLESQDHILNYQVPVILSRHNVGLLVIDSVAANYRAEFERQGTHGSNMAARSTELVRLGALLRDLARRHGLAVVVANQVADRFSSPAIPRHPAGSLSSQGSPLASRSMPPPGSMPATSSPINHYSDEGPPVPPALLLDHQQRWFTGWGDDPYNMHALKNPSLGLVWSTQISCRIALFKRPVYGRPRRVAPPIAADDYDDSTGTQTLQNWRRWMKVVFAPHVQSSSQGLQDAAEFEVTMGGLKAVKSTKGKKHSTDSKT